MCCRYFMEESPELRPIVEAMNRSPLTEKFRQSASVVTQGEIRPTNVVPVIASDRNGRRAVFPMRWGFREKSLLINARTETAAVKPVFREAWAGHRCVVPASEYYEWEHPAGGEGGRKAAVLYSLREKESAVTWLCGLYRIENGQPCFVILTREPGEEIRFIHDRMPLILPGEKTDEWIRPSAKPEEILSAARTDLLYRRVG